MIRQCLARESGGSDDDTAIEMAALQTLLEYHWPGNIRELRNTIRTALALCDDGIIRMGDLPADIANFRLYRRHQPLPRADDLKAEAPVSLESAEHAALLRVIEQHRWVMSRVAEHFGISRNTLYRKIKRHGILLQRPVEARFKLF